MDRETLDDLFEKLLQEGGGEYLWTKLNSGPSSSSADKVGLFQDPELLGEIERFMEKNRLHFATSISWYVLRRTLVRFRALPAAKIVNEIRVSEPPG